MPALHHNASRTRSSAWSTFCELAKRMGEYEAILAPGRDALTYSELKQQIADIKHDLNERGIGRGDRVAVVLPNGPEMAVSFLAVTSSAIFAPLNPAYTEHELRRYLARLKPRALLTQPGTSARKVART